MAIAYVSASVTELEFCVLNKADFYWPILLIIRFNVIFPTTNSPEKVLLVIVSKLLSDSVHFHVGSTSKSTTRTPASFTHATGA